MKLKYAWVALIALTFFGCDDNTGSLGLDMFPESDQNIKGHLTAFDVTTQSKLSGNVFAKTSIGYVGKFTDPLFGYYEAGFLAQLHCFDNLKFPTVYNKETNPSGRMVKDGIYLTELVLTYGNYFGDSLNACRMSVYELNKDLKKDDAHYTNIVPSDYYSPSTGLIARKAYSAVDLSISDSIRNLQGFYPYVRLSLPKNIGERIYQAWKDTDGKGLNNNLFQQLFKGIYVKSDYGDGTVLYIDQIEMNVVYEVYARDAKNDTILWTYKKKKGLNDLDSIIYSKQTFAATKEIIQSNHFKNEEGKLEKIVAQQACTYLKTPAGIYTQAALPLENIKEQLSKDTINAVKLTFMTYNQTDHDYKFSINAPSYVLLVRENEKKSFFEENKIADNITSYLAQHSTSTNQYIFNNLTKLVSTCLAEKEAAEKKFKAGEKIHLKDKDGLPIEVDNTKEWMEKSNWDKVALIPVIVSFDSNSTNPSVISVQNDLKPGYAKLKGGALGLSPGTENDKYRLKMEVISTSFNK